VGVLQYDLLIRPGPDLILEHLLVYAVVAVGIEVIVLGRPIVSPSRPL